MGWFKKTPPQPVRLKVTEVKVDADRTLLHKTTCQTCGCITLQKIYTSTKLNSLLRCAFCHESDTVGRVMEDYRARCRESKDAVKVTSPGATVLKLVQ